MPWSKWKSITDLDSKSRTINLDVDLYLIDQSHEAWWRFYILTLEMKLCTIDIKTSSS